MNWFGHLFSRRQLHGDLSAEMRAHLDEKIDTLVSSGMSREEATRAARREFGNVTLLEERSREVWQWPSLETFFADVRFAFRMLRKSPGFTAIAVLTLALGIGANTAIFSMVNALLLHPYPFPQLGRIVKIWEDRGVDAGYDSRYVAPADVDDLAKAGVFDSLSAYRFHSFSLGWQGNAEHVLGCAVSAQFFNVLREHPSLGREFTASETRPGLDAIVIVSHPFWERRFGGDPEIVGHTLQLDGRNYTIIGVMPAGFDYPVPVELWTPLALSPAEKSDRAELSLEAIGRLKAGVSESEARASLMQLSGQLAKAYPDSNSGRRATALGLRKELYMYTLPLFGLLQASALFVLLLAGANLANLLFARTIGRQREVAVRIALGASRRRLAQLFVCETTLLAAAAGAAAIAASFWSVRLLRISISPQWSKWVPGWDGIQVDANVLAAAVLVALLVGIVFGLAIVFYGGSVEPNRALKEGGPGPGTKGRSRLRSALVVIQVMLALVLLVCGGLAIQGFSRLANLYQGFQPASVLETEISLPDKSYTTDAGVASFYRDLLLSADAMPGVESAALVANPPASNIESDTSLFTIQGRATVARNETPSASLQTASPNYLRSLRIPLIAGRDFSAADTPATQQVAIISGGMARQFWPAGNAVGQRIKLGANDSKEAWLTIVGVVGDVPINWWDAPAAAVIYRPFAQSPQRSMFLTLRTAGNPTSYITAVRGAVRRIDAGIAITGMNTLVTEINDAIGIIRILGTLMGIFGFVALALSSIGLYGVLSESVAQRTREIGIRMALGGQPRAICMLVLRRAIWLTGIGLAIGVPLSLGISYAMAHAVFGLVSTSWTMLAGFAALLVVVALIAGYLPARRAMKVDPMAALRYE